MPRDSPFPVSVDLNWVNNHPTQVEQLESRLNFGYCKQFRGASSEKQIELGWLSLVWFESVQFGLALQLSSTQLNRIEFVMLYSS